MFVCSCNILTDADIERALVDLLAADDAPLPTPGLVYRHLGKRLQCCGCVALAVEVIYERMDALEQKGLAPRHAAECARTALRDRMARRAGALRKAEDRQISAEDGQQECVLPE